MIAMIRKQCFSPPGVQHIDSFTVTADCKITFQIIEMTSFQETCLGMYDLTATGQY